MRRDKTFGSNDLVRYWTKNLTNEERQEVLAVFLWGQGRCDAAKNILLLLVSIVADFLPFPGVRFILNLLLKLVPVGERISEIFIQETALRVIKSAGLDAQQVAYRVCNAALSAEKE